MVLMRFNGFSIGGESKASMIGKVGNRGREVSRGMHIREATEMHMYTLVCTMLESLLRHNKR